MARSNSAKAPTICIIMRPAGVVVSIASVIDRKPAPTSPIRSMMCSTSLSDRDRRSSFHTTTSGVPRPVGIKLDAFRDARAERSFGKRSIDRYETRCAPLRRLLAWPSSRSPSTNDVEKCLGVRPQANAGRLGRRGDAACVHRMDEHAVYQSQWLNSR